MPAYPSPPFLGRTGELKILAQLIATVRSGESAALVIRGEPGSGKTALLRALSGEAGGFRLARAVGVESEMELAFAGLHELCAPMLVRLGSLVEPQRRALDVAFGLVSGDPPDRFLVALGVLTLLAEVSEEKPLLCVVDDAQWLDEASAQVLGFVGRRLLAEPIGLVFTARERTAGPDHLAGLPELQLDGLEPEAARELLTTVVGGPLDENVRSRIIEETHGNPLAIIELFRGLRATELAGGFALPDAGGLPQRIEDQYVERLRELSPEARQLVLLAAADPVGDLALLHGAARVLGLDIATLSTVTEAGLLDLGANVRFRHPLARSAAYRSAPAGDRRTAHYALAQATDPTTDPDRRAWHRAHAAAEADEEVAQELISSAGRARRRGGVAAAAAFWQRAVALTPEPAKRAARAYTAAEAKYEAGDFESALALLAEAEIGPIDDLAAAKVDRARAQVAFALSRGTDAPPLLLRAARRLQPFDEEGARETFLEALVAVIYAGRLARDEDPRQVAEAAKGVPCGHGPWDHSQLLLRGLALRLTDGYAAAAPTLKQALKLYRARPQTMDWLSVVYNLVAMDLWDDDAWFELASGQVLLARSSGTLSWLPFALDYLAEIQVQRGALSKAAALLTERESIDPGIRAATLPYVPLLLDAWRGDVPTAVELSEAMVRDASRRGEGAALTYVDYAKAVLYNGVSQYAVAAEAARRASHADEVAISSWALYELVEAATRSDQSKTALTAAGRLSEVAKASGTDWVSGAAARSRALLTEGGAAEDLYRQAIELLSRASVAAHLARARLVYGEWLRRERRRVEARDQLRLAFEAFDSMGSKSFRERARRELEATGEKVRKRTDDTRYQLTPQEMEIAEMARAGRTNGEIGAQLFISARTVEWHLRKVFTKLEISSRRELNEALGVHRGR